MSVAGVHRIPEKTIHIWRRTEQWSYSEQSHQCLDTSSFFVRQPGEKKVESPKPTFHSSVWCLKTRDWLTSEIPSKRIKMSGFSWILARWKTDRSPFHARRVSLVRALEVPGWCLYIQPMKMPSLCGFNPFQEYSSKWTPTKNAPIQRYLEWYRNGKSSR